MSIRKYGRGGWRVEVEHGARGSRARRTEVVFGSASEAEAVEFRLRAELSGFTTTEDGPPNPPLSDLVKSYIEHARRSLRSAETCERRSRQVEKGFGATTPCRSITYDQVIAYIAARRRQFSRFGKLFSPATIDRELDCLRAIYTHAIRTRLIDPPYNPAQWIRKANIPNERNVLVEDEDFASILETLSPDVRLVFLLARFTGLRIHHILGLRREQVRGGTIRPPAFDALASIWKSSKRHGVPPLPASLESILAGIGPVFSWKVGPKKPGAKYPRQPGSCEVTKAFLGCREKLGKEIRFHDLRRSYATYLRRLGVSSEVRLIAMGHSPSPEEWTHVRYQVVSLEELSKVAEQIEAEPFFQRCMKIFLECSPASTSVVGLDTST